jgi:hypothetical protein
MDRVTRLIVLVFCSAPLVCGVPLLTNGGFETGTFAGWTVVNAAGSFPGSNFFVIGATVTPQSGSPTVGPASGNFYAVSDQLGPGTHALLQSFTVPAGVSSVVLAFSLFVNNFDVTVINPIGLDSTDGPNQHARVDILTAGSSPFDTGAGVLRNFYIGADSGPNPHPYTNNVFDITSLVAAGGTFQLRFAETDNLNTLNMGVDNVSIDYTPGGIVPEPSGPALTLLGLAAFVVRAISRFSDGASNE